MDSARQAVEAAKRVLDSREKLFKEGAGAPPGGRGPGSLRAGKQQFRSAQEHLSTLQTVSREEQVKTAAAQVESARAHFQSLEAQVDYSRIVSPISGVIADRPLYAGEMASPGTPLLTVMDISRVVARVNVPQAQAPRFA